MNLKKFNEILEGFTNLVLNEGDKDIIEARAGICADCQINVNSWCKKSKGGCGCYIPAKIRSKETKCPKGKWK